MPRYRTEQYSEFYFNLKELLNAWGCFSEWLLFWNKIFNKIGTSFLYMTCRSLRILKYGQTKMVEELLSPFYKYGTEQDKKKFVEDCLIFENLWVSPHTTLLKRTNTITPLLQKQRANLFPASARAQPSSHCSCNGAFQRL